MLRKRRNVSQNAHTGGKRYYRHLYAVNIACNFYSHGLCWSRLVCSVFKACRYIKIINYSSTKKSKQGYRITVHSYRTFLYSWMNRRTIKLPQKSQMYNLHHWKVSYYGRLSLTQWLCTVVNNTISQSPCIHMLYMPEYIFTVQGYHIIADSLSTGQCNINIITQSYFMTCSGSCCSIN